MLPSRRSTAARLLRLPGLLAVLCALALTVTALPARADAPSTAPRPLRTSVGLYPRAITLQHPRPGGGHRGDIVASVVTFDNGGLGAIYASSDHGRSFHQIGTVRDPAAAQGQGLCCATLFELPTRVGALPAGTLLWSASFGQSMGPDRRMSIRIWASEDGGRSWSYLSTADTATNSGGLWEPEFTVAADGRLIMFVSDETDQPAHSQKLVQASSADGRTWTATTDTVALAAPGARPGMANVRHLPRQGYLMTYEICGAGYACSVHYRRSADGEHWGDPTEAGPQIVAANGSYFLHTPTIAWSPGLGAKGQLFLVGQLLRNPDGTPSAGNGATIMVSTNGPAGPWHTLPAPVPVPDAYNNYCPNYSSTLVPMAGGTRLLEIATAYAPDGVCKAYFASESGRA